jgi:predicted RND superfamily exporter protein
MSVTERSERKKGTGYRALGWIAGVSTKHPWKTIAVFMAITLLFGIPASQLKTDTSIESLLETDDPDIKSYMDLESQFGEQAIITVVVDTKGSEPSVGQAYIQELMDGLRASGYFKDIRASQDLSFAGDRAVLYIPEEALQYLLVPNLTAEEAEAYLDQIIDQMNQPRYYVSEDGRLYLVNMIINVSIGSIEDRDDVFITLHDIIDDAQGANASFEGLDVGITGGMLVLDYEGDQLAMKDLFATFMLSFVLIIILLFVSFRSLSLPLLTLVPLLVGIIITAGIVQMVFGAMGVMTAAFAVLLLGLGIDFSIHLLTRFQDEVEGHDDMTLAFTRTLGNTGKGVILGGLTTATVFIALYFGETKAISEMGLVSAVGLLVTMVAVFFLLPALTVVRLRHGNLKAKMDAKRARYTILGAVGRTVNKHAAVLVVVMVLVGGAFLLKVPEAEVNSNITEMYPTSLPSYKQLEKVKASFNYTENYFVDLVRSEEDLGTVVDGFQGINEVERVESVLDFLPANQTAKLAIIEQAIAMNPELANVSLLNASAMTWEDLPREMTVSFVSNSGDQPLFLVRIWMKGDIFEREYREKVLPPLKEVNPEISGQAILIPRLIEAITEDVSRVSVYAVLPVLLIVYLGFGRSNPKYALLAMVPVAFALLGILALYEYTGVSLNVISIMMVPLVIGIAIDNGIHLVHRYMEEGRGSVPMVVQHTGRAIFLTSMTTILAFSSFTVAEHPGMMSLGRVPVLGLTVGLIASLVFMSALMRLALDRKEPVRSATLEDGVAAF